MKRRAKYGNTKVTVDGITFDSKAEARRYGELKLLARAGEIGDLELQPKFNLYGMGHTRVCSYRADFQYKEIDSHGGPVLNLVVEDVKGVRTAIFALKAKLFRDNYGFEITEVKA